MTHKTKRRFKNRLAIVRRRTLMNQKQVSGLLGNKSNDQISRYERGVQVPSLKNALKLGLIYNIPIRILLDRYFEECRKEVVREQTQQSSGIPSTVKVWARQEGDFCTFEEMLRRKNLGKVDQDKIGAHLAKLINRRAERLGHL